jgi:hypothetical protein
MHAKKLIKNYNKYGKLGVFIYLLSKFISKIVLSKPSKLMKSGWQPIISNQAVVDINTSFRITNSSSDQLLERKSLKKNSLPQVQEDIYPLT